MKGERGTPGACPVFFAEDEKKGRIDVRSAPRDVVDALLGAPQFSSSKSGGTIPSSAARSRLICDGSRVALRVGVPCCAR